ncbi:b90d6ccc-d134-457b-9141-878617d25ed4 [Sclerotinia trifoliorum]|uniref:B90d6ccc-d134-457b-9141-878617d25ed4 n=1 Tax=Sclerotinia trifoliorum TaxID=28548 RepID=A0A8H2W3P2_9HELO|nr:b90d6ccc-d134-457b-9141-878617d25ed4 [Sclerotinia trifoliorum]
MAPAYNENVMEVEAASHATKDSTILSSVLHGIRDVRLEVRNIAEPLVGELQVQIKSTGICGSDVSYYKKFANGDLCACAPLSLGHEASGVVVGIGPQVNGFSIGDRVALEVGISCGQCDICRKGRYNLCKKMRFRSSAKSVPHFQGTLQERINHPAVWCHKLPDHISFDAAALLEPLSVAIHSLNRAAPTPGSTAVVIGAGTVGLLVAAMARQSGCPIVTITDISANRVQYALEHGFATHGYVIPPSGTNSTAPSTNSSSGTSTPSISGTTTPLASYTTISDHLNFAKASACDILAIASRDDILGEADHEGADITFECTGKEICMQTAIYSTKPGGKVIMVGMGTPIQTLPLSAAHLREVDILGVFRYANTYPVGIRMLGASGRKGGLPSLDHMVTHRFSGLGNAKDAFELAGKTMDEQGNLVLKVVIEV